jgi:hypothetical protein
MASDRLAHWAVPRGSRFQCTAATPSAILLRGGRAGRQRLLLGEAELFCEFGSSVGRWCRNWLVGASSKPLFPSSAKRRSCGGSRGRGGGLSAAGGAALPPISTPPRTRFARGGGEEASRRVIDAGFATSSLSKMTPARDARRPAPARRSGIIRRRLQSGAGASRFSPRLIAGLAVPPAPDRSAAHRDDGLGFQF